MIKKKINCLLLALPALLCCLTAAPVKQEAAKPIKKDVPAPTKPGTVRFEQKMVPGDSNRVKTGHFLQTEVLTGSLQAQKAERFTVPYTKAWQIQLKWMVKEGEAVKAGDVVARFDTSNQVSEIETLELSLQDKNERRTQKIVASKHEAFELDVKLKEAEIDYKKKQLDASIPKGIESNFEYDRKQLDLKQSLQALKAARLEKRIKSEALQSEIKRIELEIKEEQMKLDKNLKILDSLTLKAKSAGTVVYGSRRGKKVQVGDNAFATRKVASIPDVNSLQVEAWSSETAAQRLKPGQKVLFTCDAFPQKTFYGSVKNISNSTEEKKQWGKAHYFRVLIEPEIRDFSIMKPGMSVKCIVRIKELPEAMLLPIELVRFHDNAYWVKPAGKEPLKVVPNGINEFYLALESGSVDDSLLEKDSRLEYPGDIKTK
ncbi:MAG: HlyD family efflux transporter periplasmic adaptor subunit [bacterium]|nr:HlyD family efflux transporter periplasmic adaptor subunit [bacterium]